jgi:hypothetical protein
MQALSRFVLRALRKVMRYYMKRGMAKARTLADPSRLAPSDQEEDEKFRAEAKCLEDLVDAMGYFLAHISDLRIVVSVRRKLLDNEGSWILRHQVSHWLERDKADQDANGASQIIGAYFAIVGMGFGIVIVRRGVRLESWKN